MFEVIIDGETNRRQLFTINTSRQDGSGEEERNGARRDISHVFIIKMYHSNLNLLNA